MNRRALERGAKPSRNPTSRNASGSTLIEVLVASVIMSTAVIVLISGLGTLFTTSIQSRESTTAGVVARSYAEQLVDEVPPTGAWCNHTIVFDGPAGYSVAPPAFGPCPSTGPQFQTVTITVTTPKGATEQLRMVVRKP